MTPSRIQLLQQRQLPYGGSRTETLDLYPVTLRGVLRAAATHRRLVRQGEDSIWLSLRGRNVTAEATSVLDAYPKGRVAVFQLMTRLKAIGRGRA